MTAATPTQHDGSPGCLGASQIVAFLEGELLPAERAQAEVHLATCVDCRQIVSALAPDASESAPSAKDAPISLGPPQIVPGQLVAGKYRVERVLGQGGMGVVVAAEHVALRQRVALKFLLTSPTTARQASVRFLREARVSAQLTSEHVARVLDYGLLPGGQTPFLVLEFLEGEDLGAWMEAHPAPPLSEALDLLRQAAEGLLVAHEASVVHRDIKPSNFFVARRRDGSPLVKLLDFGIAKAERIDTSPQGASTGGAFLGSPRYASPEQLQSTATVDLRTDLWSFGCVMYELLCGRPPFDGDSLTSLVAAILTSDPTPPRAMVPALPLPLEALILRCLSKHKEQRPKDMHEILRGLSPQPTLPAPSPSPSLPPAPPTPRSPWLFVALASLALAALAAAAFRAQRPPAPVPLSPAREVPSSSPTASSTTPDAAPTTPPVAASLPAPSATPSATSSPPPRTLSQRVAPTATTAAAAMTTPPPRPPPQPPGGTGLDDRK